MANSVTIVVLVILFFGIVFCNAQLHYSKSSTNTCEDDQVCEYKYYMDVGQFRHLDRPISVEADVEVICESSGFYGSITATRYCLTVTDVEGSFLNYMDNQASEPRHYFMVKNYTMEYLSGVFCFVQTSDGKIVSVFHPPSEDVKVTNFKKGIASAFQTNFKGTSQEIETDPQSRHHSHYSFSDTPEGTRIIHRTVTSDDILEYSSGIPTRDVQLQEEDDIEYRDSRLVKSSGNMHLSVDKEIHSSDDESPGMAEFADVVTAHGSFSMELEECRSPLHTRRRREVEQYLDGGSSLEEGLMATYDERNIEIEVLDNLRQHFNTSEEVIAALQNTNSSKAFSMLEKVMVLERKYQPEGVCVTDTVLLYLRKVKTLKAEEYVTQRVNIYSLLSSEGSSRAESALIEQLQRVSGAEQRAVMLAIALLPTPSCQLINTIEDMVIESNETTTSLVLVYGSLVANAPPDQEQNMVTFLADRIVKDDPGITIHILHALGNTKSSLAIGYIIPYVQSDNKDVRQTAVSALRFFTGMPIVQQEFISILHKDSSDSMVETILHVLRNGYDYDRDIELDWELLKCLVKATNDSRNNNLQTELKNLLKLMGIPNSNLADLMPESSHRQRRDTGEWDSVSPEYDVIAPASERASDVANYPYHRGFLWSNTIGEDSGDYQIYLQTAAGLFAGANSDKCDFKAFGKAVVHAHVLGYDGNILTIEGRNGRIYVMFTGDIVFDIEPPTTYTHELPRFQTLIFSTSFTFYVYGVPIVLGLEVHASIGADIELSLQHGANGSIQASAALIPYVAATIEGSAAISAVVARVGISITADIPYGITLRTTFYMCTPKDVDGEACVNVSHGWQEIDITFAAFYQLPSLFPLGYGDKITFDALTYTHSFPAAQGSSIYSSCAIVESNKATGDDAALDSASGAQSVVASFIPHLISTILMVPLLIYAT